MKENTTLYPLKFTPILKKKVWGGSKLNHLFNKNGQGKIGESWELSGVSENISLVENGTLKGEALVQLIENYKIDLVGEKVFKTFGTTFPLLFKFIDASQDLSVQLHPDDTLAKQRHNSFGKTEMWYIMETDEDARIIVGFNQKIDKDLYLKHLSENKITDILHFEKVKKGDSFFIAPGTIHAIGAGVVLAEIQQTSDITYRVYDWDRPGIDGKMRELHNDLALQAINFKDTDSKLDYLSNKNTNNLLCKSPYFETNKLILTKNFKRNLAQIDSFVVYMCVEGNATLEMQGFSETINKGETILIPAIFKELKINTKAATLLEVFIP